MNIDRIAREMVDVEPSVDLEARIRARLDEARPERHGAWWTWRVGVPVGVIATAALALAIVVQGPESGGLPAEAAPAGAVAQAGPGVVTTSLLPKIPTSSLSPKILASTLRKPASHLSKLSTSKLSAEELAWMERRIPALDAVSALEVDRLRVDSIQPEPLAITPLTMTPVGTDGAGIERRNDR